MQHRPAGGQQLRRAGKLFLPVTEGHDTAPVLQAALPSFPFWLLNAILLCAAYWVAVMLLSTDLLVEVLEIPASGWRGYALALAPFASCLILAGRARVSPPGGWFTLILAAALINLIAFFTVGFLTEESAVEKPLPISILA
jgi:hypothetical protein